MNLAELRREATSLALAQSSITRCCLALGDETTNLILSILSTKLDEIQKTIDTCEGRPHVRA